MRREYGDAKRILVTGGAGYIGSHAVLALKDNGWLPVVVDDLSTGNRNLVPDDVPFHEGSIADRPLLSRIIREHDIVAIMHFAGSISVPESVEKPLDYYRNNTIATHSLISAAVACGVKHILFSSTAAVYGNVRKVPIEESDPTAPINPYGASKLMTERMLEDCATAYGFNCGALRYFNVAGADPFGRSGQAGKNSMHLIKVAAEAAVGKRDHVDVFGTDYPTPDGTCIRDYIHVSDLAAAHLLALEWLIEHPDQNLVMNCGYGRGMSVLEVLDAVDRRLNVPLRREMKPRRAGDPPELVACNDRLMETLAWKPKYQSLDTIVGHALQWERKLHELPEWKSGERQQPV
jgi:UDP-glucose 4-epimerase